MNVNENVAIGTAVGTTVVLLTAGAVLHARNDRRFVDLL
jgi:hypothetical protein